MGKKREKGEEKAAWGLSRSPAAALAAVALAAVAPWSRPRVGRGKREATVWPRRRGGGGRLEGVGFLPFFGSHFLVFIVMLLLVLFLISGSFLSRPSLSKLFLLIYFPSLVFCCWRFCLQGKKERRSQHSNEHFRSIQGLQRDIKKKVRTQPLEE